MHWKEKALEFITSSKYADRINYLLANPRLATEKFQQDKGFGFSNCHGTVLYCLGLKIKDRPLFLSRSEMEKILIENGRTSSGESNDESYEKSNIVTFWISSTLIHSALFLGQYKNWELIFHQRDTGEPFEISRIDKYTEIYPFDFTVPFRIGKI